MKMRRASPGSPRSSCSNSPSVAPPRTWSILLATRWVIATGPASRCSRMTGSVFVRQRIPAASISTPSRTSSMTARASSRCATASAMTSSPSHPTSAGRASAPPARRTGLVACCALPLVAHGEVIGVLNLYAWPAVGFAGWDRRHCGTFAYRASNLLSSARTYDRRQVLIAKLEARLAAIPAREPE